MMRDHCCAERASGADAGLRSVQELTERLRSRFGRDFIDERQLSTFTGIARPHCCGATAGRLTVSPKQESYDKNHAKYGIKFHPDFETRLCVLAGRGLYIWPRQ